MNPEPRTPNLLRASGFTLLELLVTLSILVTAMGVIIGTFSVTLRAWTRGTELLEELHHGDFVMEQLVSALRSTAFIHHTPEKYGFWLEDNGGRYPRDSISWVTSGTAFMLPDSPLGNGLHRLEISIEKNEDGEQAVAVRAYPHLAEEEDFDSETWYVSTVVQGLDVQVYDEDDEHWDDDWEDTNAVPSLVQLTLYMEPPEPYDPPVKISRVIEIPVAPVVANAVRFQQEEQEEQEAQEQQQAQEADGAQPIGGGDGSRPGTPEDDAEQVDRPSDFQEQQLGIPVER